MKTSIHEEAVVKVQGRDCHLTLIEVDLKVNSATKVALDDARALFDTLTSPERPKLIEKLQSEIIHEIYPNHIHQNMRNLVYSLAGIEVRADARTYGIFIAAPLDQADKRMIFRVPLMVHNYAKFSYLTAGKAKYLGTYECFIDPKATKTLIGEMLKNDGSKKAMLSIRNQLRQHNTRESTQKAKTPEYVNNEDIAIITMHYELG